MEHIGAALRERRLELGLTLEEVSKKTRLQVPYLKAIEAGDIDFFKDDLSYLSYYVRHYATEIGLNYEELKSSVDDTIYDYTKSVDVGEVRKNIEISDRIKQQSETSRKKNDTRTKQHKTVRRKRNIDFSMVAFVVSAFALLIVVAIVLFHYVPIWLNDEPIVDPVPVEPQPNEPNGEDPNGETPDPDIEEPTPEPGVVTVTAENDSSFIISGWTDEQSVDIVLNVKNRTWLSISVDGVAVDSPVSKIYESGEIVHLSANAVEGKIVEFHIGYVNGNTLKVNDSDVPLGGSIANLQGSAKIYFKFVNDGGSE